MRVKRLRPLNLGIFLVWCILGAVALPVAIYVLLFVNLDFWESYWLALKRPAPSLRRMLSARIERAVFPVQRKRTL